MLPKVLGGDDDGGTVGTYTIAVWMKDVDLTVV